MDKILEFLDFSSLDPQMYWRIPTADSQKTYEISWRRDASVPWRFREQGELFWTLTTTQTLLADLRKHELDLNRLESALKHTLLQQTCFADRIVKDARLLLGDSEVNASLQDHAEFLENIGRLVQQTQIPPQEHSPHLSVVKD